MSTEVEFYIVGDRLHTDFDCAVNQLRNTEDRPARLELNTNLNRILWETALHELRLCNICVTKVEEPQEDPEEDDEDVWIPVVVEPPKLEPEVQESLGRVADMPDVQELLNKVAELQAQEAQEDLLDGDWPQGPAEPQFKAPAPTQTQYDPKGVVTCGRANCHRKPLVQCPRCKTYRCEVHDKHHCGGDGLPQRLWMARKNSRGKRVG